ncbi:hypothetical protein [Saccharopolyspora phatthalungensis]|uniref:Nitrate reductase alpha subunit n=1 Tax=Saccharopolyspora phatthalungensis TaxID=664693 RepID=A0A840Q684_9PSEU|nr:hypothetical protein [Saccharopolyspora phatthalungensis]MBB5155976.1 nitrate reductase alpha subunit [Saccharopolyspora phatthalungensis]
MHRFVRAFAPATAPPWQTRSDFDAFHALARGFAELAKKHLGTREISSPHRCCNDTPDEMTTQGGTVQDWARGEAPPTPRVTMPKLIVVERDCGAVAEKMAALGPLVDALGVTTKGWTVKSDQEVEHLRQVNGEIRCGVADGRSSHQGRI